MCFNLAQPNNCVRFGHAEINQLLQDAAENKHKKERTYIMKKITQIIAAYTAGEATLEETNAALKEARSEERRVGKEC